MRLLWHRLVSWCVQLWHLMRRIRWSRAHPLPWKSRPVTSPHQRVFAQPKPQRSRAVADRVIKPHPAVSFFSFEVSSQATTPLRAIPLPDRRTG